MIKSEKGFSLVSTMVAIGLTGVLGLVIMKNSELSGNIKQKNDVNLAVTETNLNIQKALQDRAICSHNLKNLEPGSSINALEGAFIDPANYNNFLTTGTMIVQKDAPLDGGIEIKKMEVLDDGGKYYLSVQYDTDPKNIKKLIGSRYIIKRFQLHVLKSGPVIVSCHSEVDNLVQTAATQSCTSLGGTMVAGKCEYLDQNVDDSVVNCGGDASYKAEVVDGKIKITCVPCTMTKMFTRWECRNDRVPSLNWVNICYYRTGCVGSPTVTYGLEFWEIGGTNATGGDTGTSGNCRRRRKKCPGEP